MIIGVYGGAFDPPHIGHTDSARTACESLELDRLLIVPSAYSSHKPRSVLTPCDRDRINMLRLAFSGLDKAEISDIEIKKGGLSYTSRTLSELKSMFPDDRLVFIMGSDMLLSFDRWHEPGKIAALADLAYLNRGDEEEALEICAAGLRSRFNANIIRVDNNYIDVSSTRIRRLLPLGCAEESLPGHVYGYILEHGLYDTAPPRKDLDSIREWSLRRVDEKRGRHILGCETAAAMLSQRWGADELKARTAAVLHDVTRCAREREQLQLCRKYGIIPDDIEVKNSELLHGMTGAAVASTFLNQPECVCDAIRYHTTGRPGMGLLEKIVCLADYIEPGRTFEGAGVLREIAFEDIDAALEKAMTDGLAFLLASEKNIHPRTEQTLEWLRKQRKDESLETIR